MFVKVVLTAEEGLEALRKEMVSQENFVLCVPHIFSRLHVLQFFPKISLENIHTPRSLLCLCGKNPIPEEVMCLQEPFSFFQDASVISLENEEIDGWVQQNAWSSWGKVAKIQRPPFERLIFFGNFPKNVLSTIAHCLEHSCECMAIERQFPSVSIQKIPEPISLQPVASTVQEYAWLEQKRIECPQTTTVLLPSAETWQVCFQKPLPLLPLAWIDWQEQETGTSFWRYVRILGNLLWEERTFLVFAKDFQQARSTCLTDRFESLRSWLLEQGKTWIESFLCPQKPSWATFGEYFCFLAESLPDELALDSVWKTCPIRTSKRGFFAFLRKILQQRIGMEANVLPWRDAAYFPLKKAMVPHAIRGQKSQETAILSWCMEVVSRGGSLCMSVPLKEEQGEACEPLLPIGKESSFFIASNARLEAVNRQDSQGLQKAQKKKQDLLRIPLESIRFSCKTWEEFYRYPRKTWLEKVMGTSSIPLHTPLQKAKFLGEQVHAFLAFMQPPCDMAAWETSIRRRAEEASARFPSVLLQQWNRRALYVSLQMAHACEAFLQKGWELQSEWSLPSDAVYPGRIDLLAIHHGQRKVVIIDYKTALNYAFTAKQCERGSGWQLLLYGKELRRLYPSYAMEWQVILPGGKSRRLVFSQAAEALQKMEAWIQQMQQSGCYENLPKEKMDTLPLTYAAGL